MKYVAVLHYLEGEVMDWKSIISKDEDDKDKTKVLPETIAELENEKLIQMNIIPMMEEIIQVLGIQQGGRDSVKIKTWLIIIEDALTSLGDLDTKTSNEIHEIKTSGGFEDYFERGRKHYIPGANTTMEMIFINKLINYETKNPGSLQKILVGLSRNLGMAKKFVNLAPAFNIKIKWNPEDYTFELRIGDYWKEVGLRELFNETGPKSVHDCDLIRYKEGTSTMCIQGEGSATVFDMELVTLYTVAGQIDLSNSGDLGQWAEHWVYLTSKGIPVDAWETDSIGVDFKLEFDDPNDAMRFRRWKMEPLHAKYNKSARAFRRRRGQSNDVLFPEGVQYSDKYSLDWDNQEMSEVKPYHWGMSVKDHVAKFGDITDPKYKDFTNFKHWNKSEILEAEIVRDDEDDEDDDYSFLDEESRVERLNELYPEMTEQEQDEIEERVVRENPNASEDELINLLADAIRRFNVDRRVRNYFDDIGWDETEE
mgnify:CR=1 FL=1